MSRRWIRGNRVRLLENGDAFFPRVLEAIGRAREELIVETFIWFDDDVGRALHAALIAAAKRGVSVDVTIDGYGSPDLPPDFTEALIAAGVRLHVFDPCPRVLGMRLKLFRRMHRKIVVVDRHLAYIGGINFSIEHLTSFGPRAKQDYAVEIEGPAVAEIHAFARSAARDAGRAQACERDAPVRRFPWRRMRKVAIPDVGDAEVLFLVRDNVAHPRDMERHYRAAIRAACERLVIANAFFVPGYRLLREIRSAARRGVRVTLIVQARPDQAIAIRAARTLYGELARSGVQIFEYDRRAFHGKVALTDRRWATVGSLNFDPLSLALNLEANVFVRDEGFNAELADALERIVREDCTEVPREAGPPQGTSAMLFRHALFYVLRRFHGWAELLPRHAPKVAALDERELPGSRS